MHFRGSLVLQSSAISHQRLERLLASAHPFRPLLSDHRVFASGKTCLVKTLCTRLASLALLRHRSAFHPKPRPVWVRDPVDIFVPPRQAPCLSFLALQHMRLGAPFFPRRSLPRVLKPLLPWLQKVPISGFGYPLTGFSPYHPAWGFLPSQHSWAFLFRAFLLLRDRWGISSASFALMLFHQTFQPDAGISATFTHGGSRVHLCSRTV